MFKQRFAQTALLSVLGVLAAGAAHAATSDLGALVPGTDLTVTNSVSGTFNDQLNFQIPQPVGVVTSTQNVTLTYSNDTLLNIDSLSTSLYTSSGTLLEGPDSAGTELIDTSLAPGNYYFDVTGQTTGSLGGKYTFTVATIPPVPEPAEATLLAVGFGLVGFTALRKKQRA